MAVTAISVRPPRRAASLQVGCRQRVKLLRVPSVGLRDRGCSFLLARVAIAIFLDSRIGAN